MFLGKVPLQPLVLSLELSHLTLLPLQLVLQASHRVQELHIAIEREHVLEVVVEHTMILFALSLVLVTLILIHVENLFAIIIFDLRKLVRFDLSVIQSVALLSLCSRLNLYGASAPIFLLKRLPGVLLAHLEVEHELVNVLDDETDTQNEKEASNLGDGLHWGGASDDLLPNYGVDVPLQAEGVVGTLLLPLSLHLNVTRHVNVSLDDLLRFKVGPHDPSGKFCDDWNAKIHEVMVTLVNHMDYFDGLYDNRDIIANLDTTVKRGIHCLLLDRDAPDCLIHRLDELASDVWVTTYNLILEVRKGHMQLL